MKYDELKAMLAKQKVRHRPRHIESAIQKQCVEWFRAFYPQYLCFAVPNGGGRNRIEAAIMIGEGTMAGVSDLIIVAERAVMFVEMKKPGGKQTEYQKLFQSNVERLGHTYVVCHSLQEFQMAVERWLKEQYEIRRKSLKDSKKHPETS